MSIYIKPITIRDVLLNDKYKMDGRYFCEEDIDDLVDHWHDTPQTENLYEFIGRNILGLELYVEPEVLIETFTFGGKESL